MSTPDTINIYRLYDPLDIQLLQLDMEQAAVDTGDFMPGYAKLVIYDNGFWTLTNELPPLHPTTPEAGGIDEAQIAAEKWMKNFDKLLAGERADNTQSYDESKYGVVHPKYQMNTNSKPKKKQEKPSFFENVRYIGGRSVSIELDGQKHVYYRLVYGVEVKPSKEEEAVIVEMSDFFIDVWQDGILKQINCLILPILKSEENKRQPLPITEGKNSNSSIFYRIVKTKSILIPITIID